MKCLLMGAPQIDTWALIGHYLTQSFNQRYKSTIGCDIGLMHITLDYDNITFIVWDLASNERFHYFRPTFYRGAQCAILIFDLTRHNSYNTILNFIQEIYSTIGPIPITLIGCNADKTDQLQITQDILDQLCEEMPLISYFEMGSDDRTLISAFEAVAEVALNNMGYSVEYRRMSHEQRQKFFDDLTQTINEMGFSINENNEVELLTKYGIFTINVLTSQVFFEALRCTDCTNLDCPYKNSPRKKALCIVAGGTGYSNVEFPSHHLLILAKIYAIAEDNIPVHVLNQMNELITCKSFITEESSKSLLDESFENQQENYASTNDSAESHTDRGWVIEDNATVSPAEAKTLLRTHQIQFYEGRLPFSVYEILKNRYEKIINSS